LDKIMKIGIIGLGFVGKALLNGLGDEVEVIKIDPKLNTNIEDLLEFNPEIVFLCVPTPMNNDGTQNITIVEEVISEITKASANFLLVLKSTVLPNYIEKISQSYKRFVFNPEFLRENHANDDFINSSTIIFGGSKKNTEIISKFYKYHTKCISKNYILTDIISASLIKYTINSFLATKVVFFNQLKDVFEMSNTNESWENFTNAISSDNRIGGSHMNVPGPDGRKGFGGPCFPKDTKALIEYSKNLNIEFSLLKEAVNVNDKIRLMYNEVTDREKEQNINFENKEEN